ncbi:DUF7697 family protein [Thalassospira marina]|uniref:Uncharacterized protein n=1 Tax=Thalassospira marina TaxID=2048283 RepID=A0A2N3KV17_9PROT|nr:hypothetical protein [Thalassospira marina]PKR54402.1 hypothetical protein COO20_09740 [Thalassospira marina]
MVDGVACLCPYVENEPQSEDGFAAWDIICSGFTQMRVGGMGGVIGLDMPALLELARLRGYDAEILAQLLPDCEKGLLAALAEKGAEDGGE